MRGKPGIGCKSLLLLLLLLYFHVILSYAPLSIEENDEVPLSLKPQRPSLRERIQAISR